MGSLRLGAEQAVRKCLRVQPDDRVVLITDRECAETGQALFEALGSCTSSIHKLVMEDFGARPDDGSAPLEFPRAIGEEMARSTVSIYAAAGKRGELKSFRSPMLDVVEATADLRHGHMPNITRQVDGRTIMRDGTFVI